MEKNKINVTVLVNGRKIKEYQHNGNSFVEAKYGSNYSIRVANNSYHRVMAIISVDGVDVISGKEATDASPGYVIDGQSSLNIDGFRVDNSTVAKFTFTEKDKSYTKEVVTGSSKNCGVIGVRVFSEKQKPIAIRSPQPEYGFGSKKNYYSPFDDSITCYSKSILGTKSASPFSVGTSWGEAEKSEVKSVEFISQDLISDITLYYTDKKGLVSLGVDMEEKAQCAIPVAFSGYCTPPKNWKK